MRYGAMAHNEHFARNRVFAFIIMIVITAAIVCVLLCIRAIMQRRPSRLPLPGLFWLERGHLKGHLRLIDAWTHHDVATSFTLVAWDSKAIYIRKSINPANWQYIDYASHTLHNLGDEKTSAPLKWSTYNEAIKSLERDTGLEMSMGEACNFWNLYMEMTYLAFIMASEKFDTGFFPKSLNSIQSKLNTPFDLNDIWGQRYIYCVDNSGTSASLSALGPPMAVNKFPIRIDLNAYYRSLYSNGK
jgi:hypothetical protein